MHGTKSRAEIKRIAAGNYEILKANPRHPSLHFKESRSILVGACWYPLPQMSFNPKSGMAGSPREAHLEIIYLLIPLAIVLVLIIAALFLWAVRSGQFDDLEGPGYRVLNDDDEPEDKR